MSGVYQKVTDAAGQVQFVEIPAATPTAASDSGAPALVSAGFQALGQWVGARAAETSTQLGALGGAIAAPVIVDNAGKAVLAGLSGDYAATISYGLPAVLGIFGALAAMITPDKHTGLSDEQIKTAVAALKREQLISLLEQSVTNTGPGTNTTGGNAADGNAASINPLPSGSGAIQRTAT